MTELRGRREDFCSRCGALIFQQEDGSWEHYPITGRLMSPNHWGWEDDPHSPERAIPLGDGTIRIEKET